MILSSREGGRDAERAAGNATVTQSAGHPSRADLRSDRTLADGQWTGKDTFPAVVTAGLSTARSSTVGVSE